MSLTPKEILKEYVSSQDFTTTSDVMKAKKEMF